MGGQDTGAVRTVNECRGCPGVLGWRLAPGSRMPVSTTPSPAGPTGAQAARLFRVYAALTFSFAWVPVMYTAFTLDRGFDSRQYLALWSAYYVAMVLGELPWGWVADRFGPRPLLVAGPLALAGGFAVLGHSDSFGWCRAAMAFTGAAHAMISGADSAYLYEVVLQHGRRSDALHEESVAHRWRLLGVSAADLLGGLVAAALGTVAAFDLSLAIMLAAAVVASRLPPLPAHAVRPRPAWRAAGRQLLQRPVLWIVLWFTSIFVLLRLGFQLYQPTLLAAGAHDLRLHGGLLCLLNLVAGLSANGVRRLHARLGERGTTTLVGLLMACSFGGLAVASPAWLLPLFCLQQVAFGFMQPVGRTALNQRVGSGERATLLSAQSLLARLAFALVLALLAGSPWERPPEAQLPGIYLALAVLAAGLTLALHVGHALWLGPRKAVGDP